MSPFLLSRFNLALADIKSFSLSAWDLCTWFVLIFLFTSLKQVGEEF